MPPPDVSGVVVERVHFPAGPYRLEGELAYAEDADGASGGVVIAGSHPLLGGNMHNNVVRGLGDGLAERGRTTLRFNYRGVGGSDGPRLDVARHMAEFWRTSHVPGEMDLWRDVHAAVEFLRPVVGPAPSALVGYSFGCALLPAVYRATGASAVVLVAPPLGKHDYDDFTAVHCPVLVIISDDDFTSDPARLREWFGRLPQPKRLVQAALDNHFFRGHEAWLTATVADFLREHTA